VFDACAYVGQKKVPCCLRKQPTYYWSYVCSDQEPSTNWRVEYWYRILGDSWTRWNSRQLWLRYQSQHD